MAQDEAIQRLLDERAICNLFSAYSQAVSHLDPEAAAALFSRDGTMTVLGHTIVTPDEIEAGMRETFSHFAMLQLVCHAPIINVQGDTARAVCTTTEFVVRKNVTALDAIFGRYEDALVRTSEGWRFAQRTFTMATRVQIGAAKLQANPDFLRDPSFAFSQDS